MSATPLLPWAIMEQEGNVATTHCTCMAGSCATGMCYKYYIVMLIVFYMQAWRGMLAYSSSVMLCSKSCSGMTKFWKIFLYFVEMCVASTRKKCDRYVSNM